VVRLIEPVNCVLQKSEKSKPFVVHLDKVRKRYGELPVSWLRDVVTADSAPAVVDDISGRTTVDVVQPQPDLRSDSPDVLSPVADDDVTGDAATRDLDTTLLKTRVNTNNHNMSNTNDTDETTCSNNINNNNSNKTKRARKAPARFVDFVM